MTTFNQQRQTKQRLASEVMELMSHSEEEQLRWKASKLDLMEALYYAYEEGLKINDIDVPMSFAELVRRCCSLLHVAPPCNPYESATRGRQRKGVKSRNFLERYQIMSADGSREALWKSIERAQ